MNQTPVTVGIGALSFEDVIRVARHRAPVVLSEESWHILQDSRPQTHCRQLMLPSHRVSSVVSTLQTSLGG